MPRKYFSKIVRELIAFQNKWCDELHRDAVKIYEAMKKEGKGKRNFNWHTCFWRIAQEKVSFYSRWGSDNNPKYKIHEDASVRSILGRTGKPLKPQKKSFPKTKIADKHINIEEGGISWTGADKHEFVWFVPENNRSVDRARAHPVACKLFSMLDKLTPKEWGRGGGEIIGNDEYNRDNTDEGGGGNYVAFSYGKEK